MKKIHVFIVSSSLVITAWLGVSYITETNISPKRNYAASDSPQSSHIAKAGGYDDLETKAAPSLAHNE